MELIINLLPPINATFDNINIDDIKKMIVHVKTLPGEPLFAVTGIPIKDGIFGGISCSHAVGDGISLTSFPVCMEVHNRRQGFSASINSKIIQRESH